MEKRGLLFLGAEFLLFDVLMFMYQLFTIPWLGPFLIFLYFTTWFTMHNLLRCEVGRKSIFLLVLGFRRSAFCCSCLSCRWEEYWLFPPIGLEYFYTACWIQMAEPRRKYKKETKPGEEMFRAFSFIQ